MEGVAEPSPAEWKVWALSMAVYRKGDPISFFCALAALLPVILIVALIASALTKPRRGAVQLLLGIGLNQLLSGVLKHAIKEPRPTLGYAHPMIGDEGFGNPSSHAQYCAFVAAWYFFREVIGKKATHHHSHHQVFPFSWLRMLLLVCAAVLVDFSRVYNGQHTVLQILAGTAVGLCWAFILVRTRALSAINDALIFPVAVWVHSVLAG